MEYSKTLSQQILELLKENIPSGTFKTFYNGDPIAIPQSNLPSITVSNEISRYEFGATGHDDNSKQLIIKAIYNKKDVFGKNPDQANLELLIESTVEGIDSATGELATTSILGILRRNVTLDGVEIENEVQINYLEANARPQDMITHEAVIRLSVQRMLKVSNRS